MIQKTIARKSLVIWGALIPWMYTFFYLFGGAKKTRLLFQAETGVGTDVIATAIHELSPQRDKSFIEVNCGAINDHI